MGLVSTHNPRRRIHTDGSNLEKRNDRRRLEVKSNQGWSSVCEADFDQQDAEVVCRELGCGPPSVFQGRLYGDVEALMWTREFQCEGHEFALLDCRSSGSARNSCSSRKAVGLTCSEPDIRLVGGNSRCAGTLEMKHLREWRPMIAYGWTLKKAAIFCEHLDCGAAISVGGRTESSERSVWAIFYNCVQSGSSLQECALLVSSDDILTLTCSERLELRLVGESRCAATVELEQGEWRPVSAEGWTLKKAAVLCERLDCGSAVSVEARIEPSIHSLWNIDDACVQSGSSLRDCVSSIHSDESLSLTCSGKSISDIIYDIIRVW
ncbi:scavenger receptor cysteine-rich type 1 protein M130-like [Pholidichthys leucotaenia]